MAAKILTANDYPHRIVIRVVMNPDDPESVHMNGVSHTGTPPPGTPLGLKAWEWCHECRYNWDVREFTWSGEERYVVTTAGRRRLKTNAELLAEVSARLQPPAPPKLIPELMNKSL